MPDYYPWDPWDVVIWAIVNNLHLGNVGLLAADQNSSFGDPGGLTPVFSNDGSQQLVEPSNSDFNFNEPPVHQPDHPFQGIHGVDFWSQGCSGPQWPPCQQVEQAVMSGNTHLEESTASTDTNVTGALAAMSMHAKTTI
ncbi:hypothetical protein PG984_006476 [Apiospora sp. TS-2023a]